MSSVPYALVIRHSLMKRLQGASPQADHRDRSANRGDTEDAGKWCGDLREQLIDELCEPGLARQSGCLRRFPVVFMPTQRLLRATPSADGCAAATSVRFLNCSGTPRLPCSLQLILVDREPWLSIPSFRLLNGLLSNRPLEYGVFYLSRKSGTVHRELFDRPRQKPRTHRR